MDLSAISGLAHPPGQLYSQPTVYAPSVSIAPVYRRQVLRDTYNVTFTPLALSLSQQRESFPPPLAV